MVYSGDTGWFDDLPVHVAGADLFICECTYRASHLDFHLNYELLCERKAEFDCGSTLLTHLGAQMADRPASAEFDFADDGLVVSI